MTPRNNPDGDGIAFRDWVKDQIAHERELREHEATVSMRALELQAREYERRLDGLNHNHARQDKILESALRRDVFEAYTQQMTEWREIVGVQLAEQRGAASRQSYIIGLGVSLLALGLKFIPS